LRLFRKNKNIDLYYTMQYSSFKFQENDNGYFLYFVSPFPVDAIDLVSESLEHYIANIPTEINQYLVNINFDNVQIVPSTISPVDIINKNFPNEDKNMCLTDSWKALIPAPKPKRETKKKTDTADVKEKKTPKPRAKKSNTKTETEN